MKANEFLQRLRDSNKGTSHVGLVQGKQYVLDGKIVEFAYMGGTGKAIVHPPGDPDMQSSTAVDPSELHEVGTVPLREDEPKTRFERVNRDDS